MRHAMTKVLRWMMCGASVTLAACAGGGQKPSDPHLQGARDMNFDRLIVPGERIGPVGLGGDVKQTVQHLGDPDRVNRSTFRGPGYYADEVYYFYDDECISFTWTDADVSPKIENGLRGINVKCGKWATSDGIRVGVPIQDVVKRLGEYCPQNREDGSLLIVTKQGVWYWARDRNSPVSMISVVPVASNWGGMCKD